MKVWAPAAILIAAAVMTAMQGGESRLTNSAIAVCVIALGIGVLHRSTPPSRVLIPAACAFVLGGAICAFVLKSRLQLCTAVNASKQRQFIGTELTDAGRQFRKENPDDSNDMMLEALAGRDPSLLWTAASINRCRMIIGILQALWAPLFGLAALSAAALTWRESTPTAKKQVFVSYNHADSPEAHKIRRLLVSRGIEVAIDSEKMNAGERIEDFIGRSIRESDVVVSVVSNRSLMSSWVAMETIQTLQRNRAMNDRLFVACYLDDDFFQPEYRLECTKRIDARLAQIEELAPEYAAQKLDTVDLNSEKTRLYDLRNNLGTILATFKQILCLDVRDGAFDESGDKLVAAVLDKHR